jgi:hypothetical protein
VVAKERAERLQLLRNRAKGIPPTEHRASEVPPKGSASAGDSAQARPQEANDLSSFRTSRGHFNLFTDVMHQVNQVKPRSPPPAITNLQFKGLLNGT